MVTGERQRHQRSYLEVAVLHDGPLLHRANGQDRDLRRVQHRDELLDAVHAEIRDREGSALEILTPQLALARTCNHVGPLGRDLGERLVLARAQHRNDEPGRGGDGDPYVRRREAQDAVVDEVRVDLAVADERGCRDAREDVGQRDLRLVVTPSLAQAVVQLERARHVGRDVELEDGRLPRLGQPPRDRAPGRRQLELLDLRLGRGPREARRGSRRFALDVLRDDATLRSGAAHSREVDPALACDPAGQRRRLQAAAVGPRRRRLDRLRLGGGGDPAALALGLTRRPLRRLLGALVRTGVGRLRLGALGSGAGAVALGDLLTLLADVGDRRPDVGLSFAHHDLEQHARSVGLDLLRHLLGVELVERLALLNLVALRLQPADDRPGLHALAEAGELDLGRHASPRPYVRPTVRRTAASTS